MNLAHTLIHSFIHPSVHSFYFQAAFRDNTLGLPKICPPENVMKIDQSLLFSYLRHHHTPSRMVVAAVGVDHDAFVECAQK